MRKIVLVICIICTVIQANAQFRLSRMTIGGGIGAQFGDYTVINFSPQVGYTFSQYLNAGAGINYVYYAKKYDNNQYKQTNNYFGLNLYAKVYPVSFLVLMVQPEANRMWRTIENRRTGDKAKTEKVVPTCLVGGGLRLGPVTAMIQYDLVQNENSPYGDRLFYSVGYTFNF